MKNFIKFIFSCFLIIGFFILITPSNRGQGPGSMYHALPYFFGIIASCIIAFIVYIVIEIKDRNKIKQVKEKESFAKNESLKMSFKNQFKEKSILELKKIENSPQFSKIAKEAVKEVLFERENFEELHDIEDFEDFFKNNEQNIIDLNKVIHKVNRKKEL